MYRIRNLVGTIQERHVKPSDFGLRDSSWIEYYRARMGDNKNYICAVHNCNNNGTTGGHVGIYLHDIFNDYAIIPLCKSHNSSRENMRSGESDIICPERRNTYLILRKVDINPCPLPDNVREFLRNLVLFRDGTIVIGAGLPFNNF